MAARITKIEIQIVGNEIFISRWNDLVERSTWKTSPGETVKSRQIIGVLRETDRMMKTIEEPEKSLATEAPESSLSVLLSLMETY